MPIFISGRSNLAATVYVPWDCPNNCKFCTSKAEYKNACNPDKVAEELKTIANSSVREVVFTGGEPSANPDALMKLVCNLKMRTHAFVNTTLLSSKADDFIWVMNHLTQIRGVNVSRHAARFEDEELSGIAPDNALIGIQKSLHINVVNPAPEDLQAIIKRWAPIAEMRRLIAPTTLCIRADFTTMTPDKLHATWDPYVGILCAMSGVTYVSHTSCNVCDTLQFAYSTPNGSVLMVNIHRGLEHTSIAFGNTIEVNDIVLFPDGELCYDWTRDKKATPEFRKFFGLYPEKKIKKTYGGGYSRCGASPRREPFTCGCTGSCGISSYRRFCGCSGCGGSGCGG